MLPKSWKINLTNIQIIIKRSNLLTTSTKMSICERGYSVVKMAASNVCCKCIVISVDLRSPRGRLLRSPVLKVAMLYWQLTTTRSCRALLLPPRTFLKKINLSIKRKSMNFYYYSISNENNIKNKLNILTTTIGLSKGSIENKSWWMYFAICDKN